MLIYQKLLFVLLAALSTTCMLAAQTVTPVPPGPAGTRAPKLDIAGCKDLLERNLLPLPASVVDFKQGLIQNSPTLGQLTSIQTGLKQQQPTTIVIYFHGGIVDRCTGLSTAVDFGPAFQDAHAYPIFPIYNVGYNDSIPGLTGKYGPFIEDPRGQSLAKRTERARDELAWRIQNGRGHDFANAESITDTEERFRYAAFVDGGLYRGGRMWSYMKWVVDESLSIDTGDHSASPGPIPESPIVGEPAGRAIAKVVHDYISSNSRPTRVVLIGHSTGGIYIAKFLRAWVRDFGTSDKTSFEVIMIAPAVRYDDFLNTLDAAGDRISKLRIFTMRDSLEHDTPELGSWFSTAVYGPSLLYAVSGVFEAIPDTPILGMQRFWCADLTKFKDYGAQNGYAQYDYVPNEAHPDAEVIQRTKDDLAKLGFEFPFAFSRETSPNVPATFRTTSVFHGSFPYDPFTYQSVMELVANPDSWAIPEQQKPALREAEKCDP